MPYEPNTAYKQVSVVGYRVEFSVDKSYAKPNDTIKFTIKVTADGAPAANKKVQVMIVLGAFTGTLLEGTTGSDGVWTRTWTVPYRATCPEGTIKLPCNKCSLYGRLGESPYTSSPSATVYFMFPTRLALTTDKDAYAPGETIAASAKLEFQDEAGWLPLANQTIVFSLNGQYKSATTGSNGVASVTFTAPATSGTYTITASFAGAGLAYSPARSAVSSIYAVAKAIRRVARRVLI